MLSQAQPTTILELNAKGVTLREIARVMKLSRWAVRKILRSNSTQTPEIQRAEKAEPYRQQILELLISRGPVSFRTGRGVAARHVSARRRGGRQEVQGADRLRCLVLLADAVFPDPSDV